MNCNCNQPTCPTCSCEPYCKVTVLAECVRNLKLLSHLRGLNGQNVQSLLVSINNSLRSISEMNCFTYTRTIDPETHIATYNHEFDFECIAETVCDICDTPCVCPEPTSFTAYFAGVDGTDLYRAYLDWAATPGASYYVIEYKYSTDSYWNVLSSHHTSTSIDSLILPSPEYGTVTVDFRIKAVCGEDCESSYNTTEASFGVCDPPTNVVYDHDTMTLSWNGLVSDTTSSFKIRYREVGGTTYTDLIVTVNSDTPGSFYANLSLVPFITNRAYEFSVTKLCSGYESSIGEGCAKYCSIGIYPAIWHTITGSTLTIDWAPVSTIYSYNIEIINTTDYVTVVSPTFIGLLTTYDFTGAIVGKTYKVKLRFYCTPDHQECEYLETDITIPPPEFTYYNAKKYSCGDDGCTEIGTEIVRVMYPSVLIIGKFYKSVLGDSFIYEILSVTTTPGTLTMNITTEADSCSEICPPLYIWYNSNYYECSVNNVCTLLGTRVIRTTYANPLTIGLFYVTTPSDGYIYEPTGITTMSTSTLVDYTTAEAICNNHCT